jgi:hypothetical protein
MIASLCSLGRRLKKMSLDLKNPSLNGVVNTGNPVENLLKKIEVIQLIWNFFMSY